MRPPAPPRFSTTIVWPSAGLSFSDMSRATASVPPPGAFGTMRRMGLVGQVCACAPGDSTQQMPTTQPHPDLLNLMMFIGVYRRSSAVRSEVTHRVADHTLAFPVSVAGFYNEAPHGPRR